MNKIIKFPKEPPPEYRNEMEHLKFHLQELEEEVISLSKLVQKMLTLWQRKFGK